MTTEGSTKSTVPAVMLRAATSGDMPILVQMSQRFVQDQGSRNPFSAGEYRQCFVQWLDGGDWQSSGIAASR